MTAAVRNLEIHINFYLIVTFLYVCDLYVKLQNSKIMPVRYKIKGSKDTKTNAPEHKNSTKPLKKKDFKSLKNWE